jgi:hypothetical protein
LTPALRRLVLVAAVFGILLFGVLINDLIEAVAAPWARSLSGGSTLTGEWLGEMTTPTGARHLLWLTIRYEPSCIGCSTMSGEARTCDASGRTRHYEVWGSAENWRGTAFYLKARAIEKSDVQLEYLEGKWSGEALKLTTTLVAPDIPTTTRWERSKAGVETMTTIGGHPDTLTPITFGLARGKLSEFEARCQASQL